MVITVFERYGIVTNAEEGMVAFAKNYMATWSLPVLSVIMETLMQYSQGILRIPLHGFFYKSFFTDCLTHTFCTDFFYK